jgi:2-dehydropantoate 2-reductase
MLETDTDSEQTPMSAVTGADGVRDAGLALCCVKSADTASAAAMAPYLAADAIVVVSLQGGIDNPSELRARLPQEIIPTVVYVAARMTGDGHVWHHGGKVWRSTRRWRDCPGMAIRGQKTEKFAASPQERRRTWIET